MPMWGSRFLSILPFLLMFFSICMPTQAQREDVLADRQAQEAAEQTMKSPGPDSGDQPPKAQRRKDLESILLHLDKNTPIEHVYFYDQQIASTPFDVSPFRLVAVANPTREVYRLSGFDASSGPNESLQEFNRLISALQLSVEKERAIGLATLFLNSSVPGGPGEVALDDDPVSLRLAIQNHYLAAYGDVWRALEAYATWWQQFRSATPALSPLVTLDENGSYRVILKRLVLPAGGQPEVQNWEFEISQNGQVRVLSMQMIFPVHPGLIFYDLR